MEIASECEGDVEAGGGELAFDFYGRTGVSVLVIAENSAEIEWLEFTASPASFDTDRYGPVYDFAAEIHHAGICP